MVALKVKVSTSEAAGIRCKWYAMTMRAVLNAHAGMQA